MQYASLLEGTARYEAGTCGTLVILACLPPIGIVLRHNVQHIAALECQTGLLAGYIRIYLRIVVKMCTHTHLGLTLGALGVRGHQLEGDGAFGILLESE